METDMCMKVFDQEKSIGKLKWLH